MKYTHTSVDMLHGPLTAKLIRFALPIALSSMLQQLFTAADTSVVGRFADANALAAVGTNSEIVALLVTLSAGLSVGVNVCIAKCIGEERRAAIPGILHTALVLALLAGLFAAAFGQPVAGTLLLLIQTPAEVLDAAILYLRIYLLGLPGLMLYDFGSAILRAKGNSRLPFLALLCSGIVNVCLNLFFVIVLRAGVAGVAAATGISTGLSALLVLLALAQETDEFHLSLRLLKLHPEHLGALLAVSVPSAVQGAVFCLANIFVQSSVNSFGAIATAGSTIATNFEYFGYYILTAFGQAATTFTSQNYAAGRYDRCRRVLSGCLVCSVLCSALLTLPLTVFRTFSAGLFTTDPAVVAAACLRISMITAYEPVCGLYEVPAGVLRGTGHSALPAVLTIIGTCMVRITWIFTVFRHFHSLPVLFVVFPLSWGVTIILMTAGLLACRRK